MKIRLVWTGKTRNLNLASVIDDYVTRTRRFVGFEVIELKEPRTPDDRKRILEEGETILGHLKRSDYVIALDDRGTRHTSAELAALVDTHMKGGQRDLVFVIGGPAGLSPALKDRSDALLSLSPMTLSHDLARTVLAEQLYRALAIIRNLPYAR